MSGSSSDRIQQRVQDMACAQDDPARSAVMAGRRAAIGAYLSLFQADMRRAAELCQQALAYLPDSDLFLQNIVTWILSLVRLFDKDPGEGRRALEGVIKLSQEINSPLVAVTALRYQARLHVRQGQLHRAEETLNRALRVATDPHGQLLPIASEALLGLGEVKRQWNDLEAAADHLLESIDLASQWSELAAFDAYFPLARIRLAQGDGQAARQAMQIAQQIAINSEVTIVDDLVADLQQAHVAVMLGDLDAAMRWAERRDLVSGPSAEARPGLDEDQDLLTARIRKYEHLVLARLFIQQSRGTEALELLEPLLGQAAELGRVDLLIEIQILTALAHAAEGQTAEALEALDGALVLAEPGGFVRIFLDEGEPMARLLRQAASQGIAPAYVAKLLAGFAGAESQASTAARPAPAPVQPLVEPLSERELEVLRLLATGMSNPEIAEALYVAVSTVRTHCKNIYGKLNVHNRWDAARRGEELGLI
jgi:LuxR family maltose regulon positive regulatory protein